MAGAPGSWRRRRPSREKEEQQEKQGGAGAGFQLFVVSCVNIFIHNTNVLNVNVQFPGDFNITNKQLVELLTQLKLLHKSINIKNLRPVTSWLQIKKKD